MIFRFNNRPSRLPARVRLLLLGLISFIIYLTSSAAIACDRDSDCGVGGKCIKREQRASGVCYGGRFEDNEPKPQKPIPEPANPRRLEMQMVDPLNMPERTENSCITTRECAAGFECVYAGPHPFGECLIVED